MLCFTCDFGLVYMIFFSYSHLFYLKVSYFKSTLLQLQKYVFNILKNLHQKYMKSILYF